MAKKREPDKFGVSFPWPVIEDMATGKFKGNPEDYAKQIVLPKKKRKAK